MNEYLSERINEMEESATIKMAQMVRDLRAKGKDVISLSLGEPDFDTPDYIKEAAKTAIDEGYTKYTPVPGLIDFRKAIVNKFKRDNDLHFSIDQIVVSCGAKQSIANVCLAMLNPGDEVIIFAPYWVSYYEIVRLAEGVPVILPSNVDNDFKVSPQQLKDALTDKTKFLLFSSPCNPTGSVYTKEELYALAEVIRDRNDIFIISDEIYEYINFSGKHSSIGAIDFLRDRTITVNGMSKGFAMTGWRLGYMGAPKWIADACSKIQGQFTSGAASFSQKAAAHALEHDLSETKAMCTKFEERKHMVLDLLHEIPGMKLNHPKGAFYVFPDISSFFGKTNGESTIHNADDFAEIMLTEALVGVVSGSAFGDDNCFRLSYAASEKELREAISRMKKVLAQFN
jgi:aspartate aminotransferase